MKRRNWSVALAAGLLALGCGAKAQQQSPSGRGGALTQKEFRTHVDEQATALTVELCEDLVKSGCMETGRLECRRLLTRELASCTEFTRGEVGATVSLAERTKWDAYFSDCAYETVRSLIDMEREECRKALR